MKIKRNISRVIEECIVRRVGGKRKRDSVERESELFPAVGIVTTGPATRRLVVNILTGNRTPPFLSSKDSCICAFGSLSVFIPLMAGPTKKGKKKGAASAPIAAADNNPGPPPRPSARPGFSLQKPVEHDDSPPTTSQSAPRSQRANVDYHILQTTGNARPTQVQISEGAQAKRDERAADEKRKEEERVEKKRETDAQYAKLAALQDARSRQLRKDLEQAKEGPPQEERRSVGNNQNGHGARKEGAMDGDENEEASVRTKVRRSHH